MSNIAALFFSISIIVSEGHGKSIYCDQELGEKEVMEQASWPKKKHRHQELGEKEVMEQLCELIFLCLASCAATNPQTVLIHC